MVTMSKRKRPEIVYRFRLELLGVAPTIWRTLEVPSTFSFFYLHRVIQLALGWEDYHLHLFKVEKMKIGDPNPEWDLQCLDERDLLLGEFPLQLGDEIRYEYDFGDGWDHLLVLEAMLLAEKDVTYPRCTGGARACPLEDCGGPWGYSEMLKALADPTDPDYEHWSSWAGEDFDPEDFDFMAINADLAKAFKRRSQGKAKRS